MAALPLPKVFLDTVPGVASRSWAATCCCWRAAIRCGRSPAGWLDQGYRRLSFIGDVGYAQTNADRYKGFLDAHRSRGLTPCKDLCLTGPFGLYTHYEEISRFLDSLPLLPDGYVCASDYIAHYIQQYYDDRGLQRDGAVPLTGLTTTPSMPTWPTASPRWTPRPPPSARGWRRAFCSACSHPDAACEVSYICTRVIERE